MSFIALDQRGKIELWYAACMSMSCLLSVSFLGVLVSVRRTRRKLRSITDQGGELNINATSPSIT